MRAAVFYGPNMPLRVEDMPVPALEAGEVLVQVAACGLCHTDLHYIDHGVPTVKPPPMILGHETSGNVVLSGPASHPHLRSVRCLSLRAGEYLPAHAHVRQRCRWGLCRVCEGSR
jgi:D-arabinose 1-dehydrogenase-like Zn-dependent alcohol dehydrogenase